jgi:hypothetical protein
MRLSFRLFGGRFRAAAQLKSYRFPENLFQRVDVPLCCPHLELGVPRGAETRQISVWPGVEIHG